MELETCVRSGMLRFAVGDRVRCKVSATRWRKGCIAQLFYRGAGWPEGRFAPYQIQLDSGELVFAPADSEELVRAEAAFAGLPARQDVEIHVCQAGPCRRAGGEAVLLEIEELVSGAGGVSVLPSGCLGNCSEAPNALLSDDSDERMFARLCDLAATAKVVERATGRPPSLEDADTVARLLRARKVRVRAQAREESKWNLALAGMAEDVALARDADEMVELVQDHAGLLASAGRHAEALDVLAALRLEVEPPAWTEVPQLRVLLLRAEILAALGRASEISELRRRMALIEAADPRSRGIKSQVDELLHRHELSAIGQAPSPPSALSDCADDEAADQQRIPAPGRIENYAPWRLEGVTCVSKHSAVFHFRSTDRQRGSPITRGRGGRTIWSKTWHTTLLAQVGEEANKEGPLPWIERDYTPVSTAHDWDAGVCDILIKLYLDPPGGRATSWLHRLISEPDPATVWLSRPMRTLFVPSLALDERDIHREHASILLLVAGTGVVAVPQVLHHASPGTCFGPEPVIKHPVSVVYSCRSDDALLVPELAGWCRQRALRSCTVLVTPAQPACIAAFPAVPDVDVAAILAGLDNATCVSGARISAELLRSVLEPLPRPLRVVVSGPEGYNRHARGLLEGLGVESAAITILSA
jgi:hypothetical protein